MYDNYFVLVTETHFGVFHTRGKVNYPEIFCKNLKNVTYVEGSDLEKFLLEKVGRNSLNKNNFTPFGRFDEVYGR